VTNAFGVSSSHQRASAQVESYFERRRTERKQMMSYIASADYGDLVYIWETLFLSKTAASSVADAGPDRVSVAKAAGSHCVLTMGLHILKVPDAGAASAVTRSYPGG
jgi:hypothetical protein